MELKIEFVNNTPVGEENELIEVHINGELNTDYPYCIKKGTFNYFGYNGDKQLTYSRNLEIVKDAIIKDIEEQFSEETYYVRLQVVHNTPIYDAEGNEYTVEYIEKDVFSVYSNSYTSFRWSDYRVTWYLKEDKSE